MSLFPCPECNREISDKAKTCPGCGAPVRRPPKPADNTPLTGGLAATVGILIVVAAIIAVVLSIPRDPVKREPVTGFSSRYLADSIVRDYQGDISSIDHLNVHECRITVPPSITNTRARQIAEGVGDYIRLNANTGIDTVFPAVKVFRDSTLVAEATSGGGKYRTIYIPATRNE